MVIAVLAAAGAVIVFLTIANTAARYGELPDRIPLHFWLDGTVNTWGPRPAVWLMVLLQIVLAALYSALTGLWLHQELPVRFVTAMAAFGLLMLLLLWRAQLLIISTALSGKTRADLVPFWWFFGVTMLCAIAIVTAFAH
jgi:hypothetical protein